MTGLLHPAVLATLLLASLFLAGRILEHSVNQTVKSLRVALKFEFTSNVGRINLVAIILFTVLMFAFNLDQIISESLMVGGASGTQDHVTTPALLLGLFFIGSLLCVTAVEKQK